ncbi:TPR repeat protein [Bradyrhizobium sp. USDA 4461]
MIARICLVFALLLPRVVAAEPADTVAAAAKPHQVWVDPGWRRTVVRYAITFDEQGLSTTVFDFEAVALNEKGAEVLARRIFGYNSYFYDLASSELATLKADGRVIAVDERAVRDQPASTDSSSPYFDEQRQRMVAYPDVAPGDKIKGRLIYKAKRAEFPGEYAGFWSQPVDQPPEVIELSLDAPASKPLHIAVRGVEHREERSGDRIVHHVRFRQETPTLRQIDAGSFDDAKRFEASTFADYAAFAATLNARNAPMALPDEALRKLSAEIVGDAGDVRAKVERIDNWVARNIRYVGIGLEDGGLTSQPASAVFAARYGDCKAHATVLKALLAAQGIEANFVVVNAGVQYTLTEVATQNFDHAIVYVPALDQYLDPTASLVAFDSLPASLGGKPALNIDKGTLARIPVAGPQRFVLAADTDYTLLGDGTRRARSVLSGSGLGATVGRSVAQGLERVDRQTSARRMIEQAGLSGSGDYGFPNPRELSDGYAITATFEISKPVGLNYPERIRMLPLTDPRPSLLLLATGGVTDRAFLCRSLEYRETSSLTVPEGTHFFEKPAPLTYSQSFSGSTLYGATTGRVEVDATATLDGQTIRSSAVLKLSVDAAVCPAEFATAIKAGFDKFTEFKFRQVGLTPRSVPLVNEVSADFTEGVNAYDARNYARAMALLRPYAESGNAKAQSYVGYMYDSGFGIERDYAEAIRWFSMAAEQGDSYSQGKLGYAYEYGLGTARDEKVAAQWYAKAAERGSVFGQSRLARLYRDGVGLAQDYQQAANWFSKAADQGSTWAQMNLALLYLKGQGLPMDQLRGIALLRIAADQNDSDAQYNLGYAYESGTGVPKDAQEAIKWYARASDRGSTLARARLDGLLAGGGFWESLFRHIGLLGRL